MSTTTHSTTLGATQAQKYAAEYADGAADEAMTVIRKNKRSTTILLIAAMALSYKHQRTWLEGHGADSITAIVLPLFVDYALLMCMRNLAARVARTSGKLAAFFGLLVFTGTSATANYLAAPNQTLRYVFAGVVGAIVIVETIRIANQRPDFRKLGKEERLARTVARETGRSRSPEQQADINARAAATRKRNARDKARQLRQAKTAARAQELMDAVDDIMPEIPVSPAPRNNA